MKTTIFFDGDGTLWYPATTRRSRKPHWVYEDPAIADPITEMIATPGAVSCLRHLGRLGVRRVLLSTSPLPEPEALAHRRAIAGRVGILRLLDDVLVAPARPDGKGLQISAYLRKHQLTAESALMVGDTYVYDYLAAAAVGVEGVLLGSEYLEVPEGFDEGQVMGELSNIVDRIAIPLKLI